MSEPTPTVAQLRQWFPTSRWGHDDLQQAIDAGSDSDTRRIDRARLYLLRVLHGRLLADPTKWTANGDYSEDRTAQLRAVKDEIDALETGLGESAIPDWKDPNLATMSNGATMYRTDQSESFLPEKADNAAGSMVACDGERGRVTRRHVW